MKEKILKKALKTINGVAKLGGGPICLGWTYQPPRPICSSQTNKNKSSVQTDSQSK
ncbi:MAG: cyclic lactone autoinducer peptide [Ruminococcus sp.]|nr:cyclic lactone autoinducer peptide [Ruminococcus sp.]